MRNMRNTQNLHMLPNNCVIVQPPPMQNQPQVMMHHHQQHSPMPQQHHHHHHQVQHQLQQQAPQPHHQPITVSNLGKRPIAPATAEHNRGSVLAQMDQNRAAKKQKMTFTHMPYGVPQPASVQRRNARERNRVKQVNNGFANLRSHIPSDVITTMSNGGRGASKKLSKVDTLKIAVDYIRKLKDLLEDSDASDAASTSSCSMGSQNSTGSYYDASSPMQCQSIPPPPCSESSASPTPSYQSDVSAISPNMVPVQPTYKYEVYDNCNPEDDEILDYISWWQEQ